LGFGGAVEPGFSSEEVEVGGGIFDIAGYGLTLVSDAWESDGVAV
jgi:hypothetical protein